MQKRISDHLWTSKPKAACELTKSACHLNWYNTIHNQYQTCRCRTSLFLSKPHPEQHSIYCVTLFDTFVVLVKILVWLTGLLYSQQFHLFWQPSLEEDPLKTCSLPSPAQTCRRPKTCCVHVFVSFIKMKILISFASLKNNNFPYHLKPCRPKHVPLQIRI